MKKRRARAVYVLNWGRQDIENRLGFRSAKYTDTHIVLTFLIASVFWVVFHGILLALPQAVQLSPWVELFLKRGPIPFVTMFIFFWACAIMMIKHIKLKFQQRALTLGIVPQSHDFTLTAETARNVLDRMHKIVDDPKRFVALNRIDRALANLHNIGVISDVSEMLRAQGENDEDHMESSYAMIRGFIWSIPILGFIGTVLGLSMAIGRFGLVLSAGEGVSDIRSSLTGVTAGLSVAFDTTLLALCLALVAQLIMTALKKREELFLDECREYCHRTIVSRLRLVETASSNDALGSEDGRPQERTESALPREGGNTDADDNPEIELS